MDVIQPDILGLPIDDLGDNFDELDDLAFEEEMHYIAANTLGYFFDPDFDGTIQQYYDNTAPHA